MPARHRASAARCRAQRTEIPAGVRKTGRPRVRWDARAAYPHASGAPSRRSRRRSPSFPCPSLAPSNRHESTAWLGPLPACRRDLDHGAAHVVEIVCGRHQRLGEHPDPRHDRIGANCCASRGAPPANQTRIEPWVHLPPRIRFNRCRLKRHPAHRVDLPVFADAASDPPTQRPSEIREGANSLPTPPSAVVTTSQGRLKTDG